MFFHCQVVMSPSCFLSIQTKTQKRIYVYFHKKEHHQEGQNLLSNPKNTTQSMKIVKQKAKPEWNAKRVFFFF